ncbi:plasmid stabilization protein, partial [Bacillus thuringiensis]
PRQEKQDIVIQAIQKNGTIDKPILIDKETKILKDGFSRYFVARKMKLQTIPVRYN